MELTVQNGDTTKTIKIYKKTTNGDVFKALFPNVRTKPCKISGTSLYHDYGTYGIDVEFDYPNVNVVGSFTVKDAWWNDKYLNNFKENKQ